MFQSHRLQAVICVFLGSVSWAGEPATRPSPHDVARRVDLTLTGIKTHKVKTLKKGRFPIGDVTADLFLEKVNGRLAPGAPKVAFGGDEVTLSLPVEVVEGSGDANLHVVWKGRNVAGAVCGDLDVRERVSQRLQEVGLPDGVERKMPAELSGGMKKRVGLARALVLDPEVMLYDEPTTGLDPIMTDVIGELIVQTRQRHPMTSVVVTHDLKTARKVADRVVMLHPLARLGPGENQLIFDGAPQRLEESQDARVRQFIEGQAGDRLRELAG